MDLLHAGIVADQVSQRGCSECCRPVDSVLRESFTVDTDSCQTIHLRSLRSHGFIVGLLNCFRQEGGSITRTVGLIIDVESRLYKEPENRPTFKRSCSSRFDNGAEVIRDEYVITSLWSVSGQ